MTEPEFFSGLSPVEQFFFTSLRNSTVKKLNEHYSEKDIEKFSLIFNLGKDITELDVTTIPEEYIKKVLL